jgi:hypothetical protein
LRTDRILDLLDIDDEIIPYLWYLIRSTRSGSWVVELQKQEWGLSRKEALVISEALLDDVKALQTCSVAAVRMIARD